ncbi:McrB family protein [Fuchsiella alkaliacetigena]|uniref:McrB family protein n=1 Tax=Fuchsiella alkaliacetigena TaxID=957042 RepID=UPI00200B39B5|nr:DUF3578 domain-containing protein [Fuchsiella alkaliacetigena]MCK8825398.1 DUF3578 domain-containing protein [Fuchsiella alkaliacetigena]
MKVIDNIKRDLNNYQKSYKFIVYKAFFDLAIDGKVKIDDVVEYFQGFYLDRANLELQVETEDATSTIRNIETSTLKEVKNYVKRMPLDKIDYLALDNNLVTMDNDLWSQLSRDDISEIKNYIDQKIRTYFDERVGGYDMAIPDMSREEIVNALHKFDKEYRDTEKWRDFIENKNHKYAIKYNDQLYPVKEIIRIAANYETPSFSGGREANSYLSKRGFEIVELENYRSGGSEKELLFTKKVNWSIFNWGFTISADYHEKLNKINKENLDEGTSQEIKISIEGDEFTASLRNIDRNAKGTTLQIRYDSNEKLQDFLKEKFANSYQYIIKKRKELKEEGQKRPQVDVPDENAEYINIYPTDTPYKYRFELISNKNLQDSKLQNAFEQVVNDYYQARKSEEFAGHKLGDLFRNEIPKILAEYITQMLAIDNNYNIKGSIGQGNWARVPWIAIMDKDLTATTREGIYITYIFSEKMESFYLTLMQGVSNKNETKLIEDRDRLRASLNLKDFSVDNNINLSEHKRGRKYELATICYKKYLKGDIPSEKVLVSDLEAILKIYDDYKKAYIENNQNRDELVKEVDVLSVKEKIEEIHSYINAKGFSYPEGLIENFYLSLKTKPFVLLAGISGTGKTKLVKLFAEAINCTTENGRFKLISVRPDWSDGSDLLGYSDIKGEFNPGPLIDFIKEANRDRENTYIVCLDEMNLARVEYYFSDLLSVMETRQHVDGEVKSAPLLKPEDFVKNEDKEEYAGIYLSDNLFIVGTVNMDETTHPFSKKVLDRANTIEFSAIKLDNFSLGQEGKEIKISPDSSFLKSEYVTLNDCSPEDKELVQQVVDRLIEINDILQKASLHIGYRVRDEICFYLLYNDQHNLLDFEQAFDFQLMQKILPRIQGSSRLIKRVLLDLFAIVSGTEKYSKTEEPVRIGDEIVDYAEENEIKPYPESARKLAYMVKRFEEDGFTAYWL